MPEGMNQKQALFVKEFLVDRNARQAAIRAGYSEKTAAQQASRLLTDVNIKAEIEKECNSRALNLDITSDKVAKEIAKMAFHAVDLDLMRPSDKIKALETLAKYLGMFNLTTEEDDDRTSKVMLYLKQLTGSGE